MIEEQFNKLKNLFTDIEWRLDNLYFIKNKKGEVVRFVRNESQLELWKDRHVLNIILKDRQRGFSTFIAILILDTCFFNKNQECGIIDITLPDAKKKIAKIKLAYEMLPDELKAENPLVTDNKEMLEWANGSGVYAGTSHRGGTLQILHISELGKISARTPEKAREIRTGAYNTLSPGNFIFIESTAEGRVGEFFETCEAAQRMKNEGSTLTDLDFKFFFFGWWMDGNENEIDPEGVIISRELDEYFSELEANLEIKISARKRAWYAKKKQQQKGDMFREFPGTPKEAFDASVEGAYLASIISGMRERGQIGIVPHDPSEPVNTAWDFGLNDNMVIWMHQFIGLQHRIIGYWSGTDMDIQFYWRKLQELPYNWGVHFLPHDAEQRRLGSATKGKDKPNTIVDILNGVGMRNIRVVPRVANKITAINEVKTFLPQCFIATSCDDKPGWNNEKEEDYKGGLLCLENFRREWDKNLGVWKDHPLHDWASHGYDGFETLARGWGANGGLNKGKPFKRPVRQGRWS